MSKDFNWKPYLIFVGIITLVCLFVDYRISLGLIIGTICYFVNDKLNEKKCPNLNGTSKAMGLMMLFMLLQGFLITITALICWFIGKLAAFLAAFVALTIPTFYFIIRSVTKK